MSDLSTRPVTVLRGVGARAAAKLAEAGIEQVQDLLFHLPLRYQDRTRTTPIGSLREGEEAVVEGEVLLADIAFGRRRSLVCRIGDGTGQLTLRFYYFTAAQKNQLTPGSRLRCYGEARRGASGLEMYHPEYRHLAAQPVPLDGALTPVYPAPAGVPQHTWRKLCGQAVGELAANPVLDLLPEAFLAKGLAKGAVQGTGGEKPMTLVEAIAYLHGPPPDAPLDLISAGRHPAQLRLALEELLAHHLSMVKLRREQQSLGAVSMAAGREAVEVLLAQFGFSLTAAQTRVIAEIAADLAKEAPMLRLVQGDVGSGKTAVAACAAQQVMQCGYQAAVMAPTEILAEQHLRNFRRWFAPLGIEPALLTGRSKGKARGAILQRIATGEARLVIGTHALFQEDVSFSALGLVIVDEQHRFGVHQRLRLSDKGGRPHQLVMTATPIPRTLAMTAYAHLDCSTIDELPPGRQPVHTALIDNTRRAEVIQRVRGACEAGRQAYWVCTLIEESEALQCQAAEAVATELADCLPGLSIALIHGRLKAAEKEELMNRFQSGEIQLLVATTVIEVGVDAPNASLMIIENPERLGLAQLHQLRGRVGRGAAESHCVLLFQSPLGEQSRTRLAALRGSNDGFQIAEKDLELRGPGEVLGTRQTGLMEFRIADIRKHGDLLGQVQRLATAMEAEVPERVDPLIRRWLGGAERFGSV